MPSRFCRRTSVVSENLPEFDQFWGGNTRNQQLDWHTRCGERPKYVNSMGLGWIARYLKWRAAIGRAYRWRLPYLSAVGTRRAESSSNLPQPVTSPPGVPSYAFGA